MKFLKLGILFSTCHLNITGAVTFDFQSTIITQVNYLVALGCVGIILGYIQVAFWSMPAERQTRAIRQNLFRSILRKDIVYFETHRTGELNTKLTDDIDKIHDGIGDKLGLASQFLASFVSGFVLGKFIHIYSSIEKRYGDIGFTKGWKLALVILSISPLLFISAVLCAKVWLLRSRKIKTGHRDMFLL